MNLLSQLVIAQYLLIVLYLLLVPIEPGRADEPVNELQYQVIDEVAFRGQTRRLKVLNKNKMITALIFSTDYPTHFRLKPELYPVCTPSGIPVTDTHQYSFIHHQSIMSGHGKVLPDGSNKAYDFYRKLPYPDPSRNDPFHKDHNLFHLGPSGIQKITKATWSIKDVVQIELSLEWQIRDTNSEGGQAVINEKRIYQIYLKGKNTIIDQFTQLSPHDNPVTLMADRHSLMGVRVSDLIDPDDGGVMTDSENRINPDGNYWEKTGKRKTPNWIDCSAQFGTQKAGITIISHPENIRNEFYCRKWGLMILSPTLSHDLKITKKNPLQFATRFVAHDGVLSKQLIDQLYVDFSRIRFGELF